MTVQVAQYYPGMMLDVFGTPVDLIRSEGPPGSAPTYWLVYELGIKHHVFTSFPGDVPPGPSFYVGAIPSQYGIPQIVYARMAVTDGMRPMQVRVTPAVSESNLDAGGTPPD